MSVLQALDYPNSLFSQAVVNKRLMLANGLESIYQYHPIARGVYPGSMFRPDDGASAADTPGSPDALSGDYVYRYTEYSQTTDDESPANETDIEVTANSGQVTISGFPAARNSHTTHWRVYRTVAGGAWPVMARVGEVAIASPASLVDSIADEDLDFANEGLVTATGFPENRPYLVHVRDRLILLGDRVQEGTDASATNGSLEVTLGDADIVLGLGLVGKEIVFTADKRAYAIDDVDLAASPPTIILGTAYAGSTGSGKAYTLCGNSNAADASEPRYPNRVPASSRRYIEHGDGDRVTGGCEYNGACLVFKRRKVYLWEWDLYPQEPYGHIQCISKGMGCLSHWTAVECTDGIARWLGNEGIVEYTGGKPRYNPLSLANQSIFSSLPRDDDKGLIERSCAVDWSAENLYIVTIPQDSDTLGCSQAAIYDYANKALYFWEFNHEIRSMVMGRDDSGDEIVLFGDTNGYVWQLGVGHTDGVGTPAVTGTVSGTISSASDGSPATITDNAALFIVTDGSPEVLGLDGCYVTVQRESDGVTQTCRIASNGLHDLYVDALDWVPEEGDQYWVGGIDARYESGWIDFGVVNAIKRAMYTHLVFAPEDEPSSLRYQHYTDFNTEALPLSDHSDREGETGYTDRYLTVDLTNEAGRERLKLGGVRATYHKWAISSDRPAQPFEIRLVAFDVEAGTP